MADCMKPLEDLRQMNLNKGEVDILTDTDKITTIEIFIENKSASELVAC